jgi:FdhD protein
LVIEHQYIRRFSKKGDGEIKAMNMNQPSVESVAIQKMNQNAVAAETDLVVVEEPLQLLVRFGAEHDRREKTLAITMRTPSHDAELAMGFLFTEGIIRHPREVLNIRYCETVKPEERGNVLKIELSPDLALDLDALERHFYTTSSCGICGKTSMEAVKTAQCYQISPISDLALDFLGALPQKLEDAQTVFRYTGGIHAAALFDLGGDLMMMREDIGRHNALDKLIGAMLAQGLLPTNRYVVLVSGRAGFELVQKAAVAGIPALVAIGAPSSLAVNLARSVGMQLYGFVRTNRANRYV